MVSQLAAVLDLGRRCGNTVKLIIYTFNLIKLNIPESMAKHVHYL